MHRDTDQLAFPMLVDHGFTVLSNHHNTAMTNSEIQIRNLQETLTIKCENRHDYEQWIESLNLLQEKAFCFENKNDTRFHSFAQIRYNQLGYWFINGKSYMESIAKAILLAKEEIFITDWWLSPEIMLIRPNDDETMRLDNLLEKKAVIRHPNHNRLNNTLLWSHNEKSLIIDQKIAFIGGIDLCFDRWDNEFHRLVDLDETTKQVGEESMDTNKRYFIGKDYVNIYEGQIDNVERFGEDFIDRKMLPRTPWHDEALVVFGEVARDAARHFIQRWNIHKTEKFANDSSYSFILPKTYDDKEELTVNNWKEFLKGHPCQINAQQCVRSVGPWSASTRTTETSILNAYIQMIDGAEHFIFIENEFFVTVANDSFIQNPVSETLYQRIVRAHRLREKFCIYIVLPLLPGSDNVNIVQASLYFIMRSIAKGDNSLFKRLEIAGIQPNDYISFFGLRQYDILMGRLVTETIFVHSKLMIVDDQMAICGSANINDRSLLGERDSELCVVINDIEEEQCLFNGRSVRVGKFFSSWRRRLFSMILGTMRHNENDIDVSDPVSDQFYNYFREVAHKNTLIYEEIFGVLPTNCVRRFDQMYNYTDKPKLKDTDPNQAHEKLKNTQGLVVDYPVYFLDEESYLPSLRTREGISY
ncbi:unnamed protein product [Adineta steineri]|uniref:phospholipase D n=1 Tax=Adineta steineri TaxID=433720 RepID=A0A815AF95_9BILA|nr:unnamed protein product [Adineta steineri]